MFVGAVGVGVLASGLWQTGFGTESGVRQSGITLGERIYDFGVGENGIVPRTAIGPAMMGGGCRACHGEDGRGGEVWLMMLGRIDVPDIRYDALAREHADESESPAEPISDPDIRRTIEDGVHPDGEELDVSMPRWSLSDTEFEALLDYLKELSER